jgi:hypothetical protein
MPIIRSLSTAVAASGLPLERGGSSVVGCGRSDRTDHDQQHCYHHVPAVNQRRLLQLISSWWWAWKCPKHVELYLNDRQEIREIDASGWLIYLNIFSYFHICSYCSRTAKCAGPSVMPVIVRHAEARAMPSRAPRIRNFGARRWEVVCRRLGEEPPPGQAAGPYWLRTKNSLFLPKTKYGLHGRWAVHILGLFVSQWQLF